jgi:hypothetical protein
MPITINWYYLMNIRKKPADIPIHWRLVSPCSQWLPHRP